MSWTWLGLAVLVLLAFSMADGYRHGFVKEVVSVLLVLLSVVVVWMINPYVNTFIRENTSVYEKIQNVSESFVESLANGNDTMDEEQQDELISGMGLPGLLQNGITENNTAAVYQQLAVNTFGGYVSRYLANIAVNCLSFLISYILASVLIRVFAYALDILARLPVVRGINKLAGALIGGGKCIIFVWVAMLVLTILCNTEIGQKGLGLIRGDTVLNFLYDKNIFIRIFAGLFYQ
ncbi:CvpA family protein [Blautia sp. CLA-JM-H16]|uniref:CvpA family protein n=1 Tax=Blautia aquisgranensis TaxID=3133153 RepID=A0ABV1BFC8_9FIRM